MKLTPEQKSIVAGWVAAGDGLGAIQKKLAEELKISMTYMEVRFLVDDLDLSLKDPAPKADASDVSKVQPKAEAAANPAAEADLPAGELPPEDLPADDGALPVVTVEVDKVTLIPGAMASGTVNFPGGVTGKWIVDHQGRPALTDVSQPGYKPSPEVVQAFMQELSAAFQSRGY